MNAYIYMFLVFGACFGYFSFHRRHLFSEGPVTKNTEQKPNILDGRVFWVLLCSFLWPVMLLTGINTAWVLFKRKKRRLESNV